MIVNRKAVIVSALGASLAAGSARASDAGKTALNLESSRESLAGVLEAIADGNLGKAAAGLGGLWGEGKTEGLFKKVQQNDPSWGGATGRPPVIEPLRPTRPDPPRQEPPRQTPPAEIPRLPPSNINPNSGTIRPA